MTRPEKSAKKSEWVSFADHLEAECARLQALVERERLLTVAAVREKRQLQRMLLRAKGGR